MLYMGIDGRYDEVSHHTIYLAKDYRGNLHDIEKGPHAFVLTRRSTCKTRASLTTPWHLPA